MGPDPMTASPALLKSNWIPWAFAYVRMGSSKMRPVTALATIQGSFIITFASIPNLGATKIKHNSLFKSPEGAYASLALFKLEISA